MGAVYDEFVRELEAHGCGKPPCGPASRRDDPALPPRPRTRGARLRRLSRIDDRAATAVDAPLRTHPRPHSPCTSVALERRGDARDLHARRPSQDGHSESANAGARPADGRRRRRLVRVGQSTCALVGRAAVPDPGDGAPATRFNHGKSAPGCPRTSALWSLPQLLSLQLRRGGYSRALLATARRSGRTDAGDPAPLVEDFRHIAADERRHGRIFRILAEARTSKIALSRAKPRSP